MRRYRFAIDNVRSHLRSLWAVIAIQAIVIAALWFGWSQAPRQLTVHIPPDLRSGAVLAVDAIAPANVYAFAFYIFQQLNRWPEDGARDYGRAIFRVAPYLTPRYRADLIAALEQKGQQGELAYRVRGLQPIPGHGYEERRVDVLDGQTWIVWLDVDLLESVKGMTVKRTAIRYPLRVVRYAVDPETNPWGLALDGFGAEGPRRLEAAERVDAGSAEAAPNGARAMNRPMPKLLLTWLLGLFLLPAGLAEARFEPPERIVWQKTPISLELRVGTERLVHFPGAVQVGVPAPLQDLMRIQSIAGTLYLLAHQPFAAYPCRGARPGRRPDLPARCVGPGR